MPAYYYVCVCHSCRPLWNPHRMVHAIVCTSFAPPLQMVLSDSGSGSRDSIYVTVSEKINSAQDVHSNYKRDYKYRGQLG